MAQENLAKILEKYKDNPVIQDKISYFIENQLPRYIQSFIDKRERIQTLELKMKEYMSAFNSSPETQYFYIHTSNTFVHYIKNSFTPIVEDKVWYRILTDISAKNTMLMDWKYKVKTKLVKHIKEGNIFHCIPESDTIQSVLQFLIPTFFHTKEEAKYFLTILGDNILKKEKNLIHLIHANAQPFLDHLRKNTHFHFKTTINPILTFQAAFTDTKPFASYRHAPFSILPPHYNSDFLRTHILDILVVASHYSKRFENSDQYLLKFCHNNTLRKQSLYFKDNSKQKLMEYFVNTYFKDGDGISTTDIFYIWKEYLKKENLPSILGEDEFILLVQQCTEYDKNSNFFPNINSKYLNHIIVFKNFWQQYMFHKQESNFEISELCTLSAQIEPTHQVTEIEMLNLIEHFFPSIVIHQGKYVLNMGCKLWCKETEIMLFLKKLKTAHPKISFYGAYEHYCKHQKNYVASKKYFEKIIQKILPTSCIEGNTLCLDLWCP